MATAGKHVRVSDPELPGVYEIVEQRSDGSLVLRPEQERLSDVLNETEGAVFRDDEFIAPSSGWLLRRTTCLRIPPRSWCRRSSGRRGLTVSSAGCRGSFIAGLREAPPVFPPALRVQRVQGAEDIWDITFAPDGRATFRYGEEVVPGEPHVLWRRVGSQPCSPTRRPCTSAPGKSVSRNMSRTRQF
jgi:hypothetical protein